MKEICLPETLPDDYDLLLKRYTHQGYRVIAVACKVIENVGFLKLMKMKREEVESNLSFLGFIIFENKIKEGTREAIKILNKADIRQVMVTGDNALTAISVSRECGLVSPENHIFVPSFSSPDMSSYPGADIRWEDCEDDDLILDKTSLIVCFLFLIPAHT